MSTSSKGWITIGAAAKKLGISSRAVRRLVEAGRLTTKEVPGCHRKVWGPDVAALAAQSVKPARSA